MDTLGVAVVGCGLFGQVDADSFAQDDLCRLVAVCDIDAEKARAAAGRFGCEAVTKVEALASDDRVAAVAVATPDFAHREVVETLARAGKHILVEKPLATTVADAEAIAAAVREAGVTCMVDFHNRYHPTLTAIKERLDGGGIGRPQAMFIRLSDRIEVATDWFSWASRSGPEWFLGSHIADVACWLFGDWPVRVFADGRKDVLAARGVDCNDTVQMHLTFPEGMATLETSWIMPDTWPMICDFSVSVQATAGRADATMTSHGACIAGPEGFEYPEVLGKRSVAGHDFGFFRLPLRDFARAVLGGRPAPIDIEEGVRNVKIIAAALESVETGRVVELRL